MATPIPDAAGVADEFTAIRDRLNALAERVRSLLVDDEPTEPEAPKPEEPAEPEPEPDQPIDLTLTTQLLAADRVSVQWPIPEGVAVAGWEVGRDGDDSTGRIGPWSTTVAATATFQVFWNLIPGDTYVFHVRGDVLDGRVVEGEVTVTVPVASDPVDPEPDPEPEPDPGYPGGGAGGSGSDLEIASYGTPREVTKASTHRLWYPRPEDGSRNLFMLDVDQVQQLDPNSDLMAKEWARDVASQYGGIAVFNQGGYYPAPMSFVPHDAPRKRIGFRNTQNKSSIPTDVYRGAKHFLDVPISSTVLPSSGRDGAIMVYQPGTDTLWEWWRYVPNVPRSEVDKWGSDWVTAGEPGASWGGRLDNYSDEYDGTFPSYYGMSASSIAYMPTVLGIEETRFAVQNNTHVGHALAMVATKPRNWDDYWYPANRSDGYGKGVQYTPEGARLRLDPDLDVESFNVHPVCKVVMRTMQKKGGVLLDKAGGSGFSAEWGAAAKQETGVDPWKGILGSTPGYQVMRGFPWDKLQVLPEGWGKR